MFLSYCFLVFILSSIFVFYIVIMIQVLYIFSDIKQDLASIACKGADSSYFWFCGL